MRAIEAKTFSGYGGLQQIELAKPQPAKDKVLVRITAAGVGGVLITLGHSAGRKALVDPTDLIWKGARMSGFSLFAQPPAAIAAAWREIIETAAPCWQSVRCLQNRSADRVSRAGRI